MPQNYVVQKQKTMEKLHHQKFFPDNLLPTRSKTISEKSFIENEYHMYHVYNWWDVNCPIMNVWIMKYSYTIYRYDILSLVKPFKIRHRDQLREHPSWEHKESAAFSEALSALYHPAPNPSTYYNFRPWQAEQTDPKQMFLHRFFSHKFLTCLEFSWHVLRFLDVMHQLVVHYNSCFEVRTPTRRTGSTGTPHWNAWKKCYCFTASPPGRIWYSIASSFKIAAS